MGSLVKFAVPISPARNTHDVITSVVVGVMKPTPSGLEMLSSRVVLMDSAGRIIRNEAQVPGYLPRLGQDQLDDLHDGNLEPAITAAIDAIRRGSGKELSLNKNQARRIRGMGYPAQAASNCAQWACV